MKSLLSKIRTFVTYINEPAPREVCKDHGSDLDEFCETCARIKNDHASYGPMYLP